MKRYQLRARDFIRGALMAVLTPVLYTIQASIANGELTFNWRTIGMTAAGGFVAYLLKNYFTDDVKASEKTLQQAAPEKLAENV